MRRLPAVAAALACVAALAACGSSGTSGNAANRPGAAVYPLTGRPAPSPAAAKRPVLAVKIDNIAGAFPQWGVNRADVVVEEVVEGGLTRLVAAFQSQGAARVGPIRSARPVDADLERLWNGGLLAYSGAAPLEIKPSIDHGHAVLVNATTDPAPFFRASGYASPHNLFASTAALYRAGERIARAQHRTVSAPSRPIFDFGRPSGTAARRIGLVVSPFANSTWRYAPRIRSYLRWQNGTPDDAAGAGQIRATNVIVMQVRLVPTSIVDAAGNHDPLDVVLGSGKAWVFSHGLGATGTWSRASDADRLSLRTAKGRPMRVAPGTTWIELLPVGQTPTASAAP